MAQRHSQRVAMCFRGHEYMGVVLSAFQVVYMKIITRYYKDPVMKQQVEWNVSQEFWTLVSQGIG